MESCYVKSVAGEPFLLPSKVYAFEMYSIVTAKIVICRAVMISRLGS